MRYMLDTDTCIFAMAQHSRVMQHVRSHRSSELTVSAITESELRFGVAKSGQPHKLDGLERWMMRWQVLDLTSIEAEVYAGVRAMLERAGEPIGPLDTLIAAHAIAQDLILVTNNTREFRRVPGLRVENWAR